MAKYTKADILNLVEEEDIEFIRLQFVDVFGMMKNLAVTSSQIGKILDGRCNFEGFELERIHADVHREYFLKPVLDTFEIFPWRPQQGKVARLICNIVDADGNPVETDSRYVLQKVLSEIEKLGYTFNVGPECEFFLFKTDEDGEPTTELSDKGECFDIGPVDTGENARREMVMFMEDMDFDVDSSYHSNEAGQHEIDFKYDNAVNTADNIITFKMLVRIVARRHGYHATFMPKPDSNLAGSGMHLNFSLLKNGKNVFEDPNGENGMSKEAYYFIAGILSHIEGMTLIHNPLVNSYKRLGSGFRAPFSESWSADKRDTLIRLATKGGNGARLELRSPDGAMNPYLSFALILASGLDGIRNKTLLPVQDGSQEKQLPRTLDEAIEAFRKDDFIRDILGEKICEAYITEKTKEWNEYMMTVSDWELEKYLRRI
jgi:glutamine synthetase